MRNYGNKRHIDVKLQSALRVYNYDDFREGKLEVFGAILGGIDIFVYTNKNNE